MVVFMAVVILGGFGVVVGTVVAHLAVGAAIDKMLSGVCVS